MKDWWKWLVAGLVLGGLLTGFVIDWSYSRRERRWLEDWEAMRVQLAADSAAFQLAAQERLRADSARRADSLRAAAAEAHDQLMADSVAQARRQLAAARTAGDSLKAALKVIANQDHQLADKDDQIWAKDAMLASARLSAHADSLELATTRAERDRLKRLVDTAPVGTPKPKLLGFLPMPRFVVGGGVVGDKEHVGLGFFAGPAFPI